jgi:hypothetical protein
MSRTTVSSIAGGGRSMRPAPIVDSGPLLTAVLVAGVMVASTGSALLGDGVRAAGDDVAGDAVVIRVGTHEVTRATYEEGLALFRPDTTLTTAENQRVYTRSVVDRLLLLSEAEEAGYFDTNPRIEQMVSEYVDYLTMEKVRNTEVRDKASVTDAEVREFYSRHNVLYDISQIIVPTEAIADEVHERLRAGESFEDLAREYSVDAKSRSKGGHLSPFVWGATSTSFMLEIAKLEPGEVSEPFSSEYGIHIFKLNGILPKEQKPLEETYDLMQRQAVLRAMGEIQRDFYASLRELYHCQNDLALAMMLAEIYVAELDRAESDQPEAELAHLAQVARSRVAIPDSLLFEPLVSWDMDGIKGVYTVQDHWTYMLQLPAEILVDRRNPHQILNDGNAEFHRHAIIQLGRERGYPDEPDIKAAADLKREEILVTMFYQDRIIKKATFTAEDERRYYDEHPDRFSLNPGMRLARIVYREREPAIEAQRMLEQGGPELEAMVNRHQEAGYIISQEPMTGWLTPRVDEPLFDLAGDWEVGQVGRYIEPEYGYWTVFRILEKRPGGLTPYEESLPKVREVLQTERSEEVLNEFLTAAREKHEVWVDPSLASTDELSGESR